MRWGKRPTICIPVTIEHYISKIDDCSYLHIIYCSKYNFRLNIVLGKGK